jgi:hypothetical protein
VVWAWGCTTEPCRALSRSRWWLTTASRSPVWWRFRTILEQVGDFRDRSMPWVLVLGLTAALTPSASHSADGLNSAAEHGGLSFGVCGSSMWLCRSTWRCCWAGMVQADATGESGRL